MGNFFFGDDFEKQCQVIRVPGLSFLLHEHADQSICVNTQGAVKRIDVRGTTANHADFNFIDQKPEAPPRK